jgi:hypothetical protein
MVFLNTRKLTLQSLLSSPSLSSSVSCLVMSSMGHSYSLLLPSCATLILSLVLLCMNSLSWDICFCWWVSSHFMPVGYTMTLPQFLCISLVILVIKWIIIPTKLNMQKTVFIQWVSILIGTSVRMNWPIWIHWKWSCQSFWVYLRWLWVSAWRPSIVPILTKLLTFSLSSFLRLFYWWFSSGSWTYWSLSNGAQIGQ